MWRRRGAAEAAGRVVAFEPRRDSEGQRLLRVVAAARGVTAEALLERRRCRAEVALARQIAMYLMRVEMERAYAEVARFFGRDRTTVAHACGRIEELREAAQFDAELDAIEREFRGGAAAMEAERASA